MYIIVIRRALIVNGGSHRYIGRTYFVVQREILIEVLYASQINLNEQGSIPKVQSRIYKRSGESQILFGKARREDCEQK